MARTESWIQGYWDAHECKAFDPGAYDADEYRVGWECGKSMLEHGYFNG
jgi:hypothetical protein